MDELDLDKVLSLLVGGICKRGHRIQAELVLAEVKLRLKRTHRHRTPLFLHRAITNLLPKVRLRNRRKAGVIYKVPAPLSTGRRISFACRWFRHAVENRSERELPDRIVRELYDAYHRRGEAYKRKEGVHSTALLNRGFIRFSRR